MIYRVQDQENETAYQQGQHREPDLKQVSGGKDNQQQAADGNPAQMDEP